MVETRVCLSNYREGNARSSLEFVRICGIIEPINGGTVKYRIAMWAAAGLLIAGGWALYASATLPPAMTSGDPLLPLVELTCPIAAASFHFHFGVSLYWSLLANAATYALIGAIVEALRKTLRHAH